MMMLPILERLSIRHGLSSGRSGCGLTGMTPPSLNRLKTTLGSRSLKRRHTVTEIPLIACPCCGCKTIADSYDICDICGWENDPVQTHDPDTRGESRRLREAQRNFATLGAKDRHKLGIDIVRPPGPEDERDPDWRPLREKSGEGKGDIQNIE
jgi:hypothetical protein